MFVDREECNTHVTHGGHCPHTCHDHECKNYHLSNIGHIPAYARPIPIPGESPMEAANRLNHNVKEMNRKFNSAICQMNGVITEAKKRIKDADAYYDYSIDKKELWTEANGTSYWLIRIPRVDNTGSPIEMKLHLAYGDASNAKIIEDIRGASKFELADTMFSAAIGNPDINAPILTHGFIGHAFYNSAPINSYNDGTGYTVGFQKNGRMKWYNNAVDKIVLQRDCIENSMGCAAIAVLNHTPTSSEYWGAETDSIYVAKARIMMGQNYATNDTYVLVCGVDGANQKGMGFTTACDIMAEYCDIAVTMVASAPNDDYGVTASDKGFPLITPSGIEAPSNYAFWYVSRAPQYLNGNVFEIATLMQMVGQLTWFGEYHEPTIVELIARMDALEQELTQIINDAEQRINQELQDAINELNQIIANFRAEFQAKLDEMDALVQRLVDAGLFSKQGEIGSFPDINILANGTNILQIPGAITPAIMAFGSGDRTAAGTWQAWYNDLEMTSIYKLEIIINTVLRVYEGTYFYANPSFYLDFRIMDNLPEDVRAYIRNGSHTINNSPTTNVLTVYGVDVDIDNATIKQNAAWQPTALHVSGLYPDWGQPGGADERDLRVSVGGTPLVSGNIAACGYPSGKYDKTGGFSTYLTVVLHLGGQVT